MKLEKLKTSSTILCGSFEIVKRIGPIAYELKLLDDWKIHITFHVSLLRNLYAFNPNHIVFEFHILALKVVFLREHEKIV